MRYKIGEIFDLQMGKTPDRNNLRYWNDGTNKWISIADITKSNKYIDQTNETISHDAVSNSGIKVIPSNTVIMSFKLSLGKCAITKEPMFSNEAIMAFINKNNIRIDSSYLYYNLMSRDWTEGTNKAVMGKTLNKATLLSLDIDIHDYNEQCHIVSILDYLTEILNKQRKILFLLDELIKSRFVEMFGDPVQNESGWQILKLKAVSSKIGSGATPRGGKENYQDAGVSLVRSMNVYDDHFEYKNLAHLTDIQADGLRNVRIEDNDILFNITGASVARSCIVPKDILPARVNQHVSIIRCKKDSVTPIFINKTITNSSFKNMLLTMSESGGATRQAITKEQLEQLDIIIPPLKMQSEFANFVEQVDKSKLAVKKSLDETQLLYDSLMQKYFG